MAQQLPHLTITGTASTDQYVYPGEPPIVDFPLPHREGRSQHAAKLSSEIEQATAEADEKTPRDERDRRRGITLEFESDPEFELALNSLENRPSGIELDNVRSSGSVTRATVFVPEGQVGFFLDRIEQYENEDTESGLPRHQKLVESISQIRLAALEAFWTDDPSLFPETDESIWWEVWIRTGSSDDIRDEIFSEFVAEAAKAGLQLGQQTLRFPERLVLLARANKQQLANSINLLNLFAELRRAKEVPTAYVEMTPKDQMEFIERVRERIQPASSDAPAVCLLDTGVNRSHPLLEQSLDESHVMAVEPSWPTTDRDGHGTEMAGIALYGCLTTLKSHLGPVILQHRLESVKILPDHGENAPENYGAITTEAVSRAEVESPERRRVACLTITADDRDSGSATSWSAAIDQFASGVDDEERRLFVVSAGNINGGPPADYPRENRELHGIQDPAQSWNALTVGAFTEKGFITSPEYAGWKSVAPLGGLCPTSTTSQPWKWTDAPFKPDIVLEGGNCGISPDGAHVDFLDDLSLLTTCVHPTGRRLTTTGETSAAAAQAARYAAILQSEYPEYWPETIRGLMVHSAKWTSRMMEEFPDHTGQARIRARLRNYGYGVPDLGKARWSALNQVTLVIEQELQPFGKIPSKGIRPNEMHFHELPWPKEALQSLGETEVTMRVTLSYFIEPSPERRGWTRRHRFQSHGLRFKAKRPLENLDSFKQRLTRSAWDDPDTRPESIDESREWMLGPQLRTRGSLHSDQWTGTAADLAESGVIGIYPVGGWWRERPHLARWDRKARYALIVSIETPRTDVDLYAAVQNEVAVSQQIEIVG